MYILIKPDWVSIAPCVEGTPQMGLPSVRGGPYEVYVRVRRPTLQVLEQTWLRYEVKDTDTFLQVE